MINLFQPTLGKEELLAIADSFSLNWIGRGAKTLRFEREWAKHIGADFNQVVSVNSCTEGLFTAIRLLDIGPGDEVIIPTIHFIGAAQAVLAAGAIPVFCDVDSQMLNTTADFILSKVNRKKTKAIILNHYGGVPCQMGEIMQLLEQWPGIYLIEDAACAPASTYQCKAVGTFGDIGVWSFDAMKIITTGDGGMMYIRDTELASKAHKMLYLGTDTQSGLSSSTGKWWEFSVEIGGARRSVMNDMAAAMGLEQLKKLEGFLDRRDEIAAKYIELLFQVDDGFIDYSDLIYPNGEWNDESACSYYFYWIQTSHRDELAAYLKANDIYTSFRYYPLHWAYGTADYLPNAEKAANETLLLPLHCGLTDSDVEYVCKKVREFYAH